jgi:NhaP-type Na+/H+ or K+/H+ antiporter
MSPLALLAFSITLVAGVLLSGWASRTILSVTVLFLFTGIALGAGGAGIITFAGENPSLQTFAEWALVAVLFTDGMRLTTDALRRDWRLPGRALLIGMPLTMLITGVLARTIADVSWREAWLTAAALSPTDPVFASALVGSKAVPSRVQHLLNVESGVNDGLALPVVVTLLAVSGEHGETLAVAMMRAAAGVGLGIGLTWVVARLESTRAFFTSADYRPMAALSIGLLVFTTAKAVEVNEFLAAFAAGVTLTAVGPKLAEAFHDLGKLAAETLKLAAVLVFGALLSTRFADGFSTRDWVFAVTTVVIARAAALGPLLLISPLNWRERLTVAWFGPKGFASVFFGVIILGSGFPGAAQVFELIALVVAVSMVAHSSTDVMVANWLGRNTPPE